jgi:hypothetical protein
MNIRQKKLIVTIFAIQILALLTLAVFRSDELLSYTYDLPPNGYTQPLVAAAEEWHRAMEAAGAASLTENVLDFISSLRDSEEDF